MIRDIDQLAKGSRIYIYGTGSAGKSLFAWLKKCRRDIEILGFFDSKRSGRLLSLPVFKIDSASSLHLKESYDIILIASGDAAGIIDHLSSLGAGRWSRIQIPSYLMDYIHNDCRHLWKRFRIFILKFFYKRRYHLFFGEHGGQFIGNNKYYYLYLRSKFQNSCYWVVEKSDSDLYRELTADGISVVARDDPRFGTLLFRAAFFYFDNMTWQRNYPWLRFYAAKVLHLSHGVGLKLTERMLIPDDFIKALTPRERKRLDGRIFPNDLLVSTSEFYRDHVSVPAYDTPAGRVSLCGYPKNDLFYRPVEGADIYADKQVLDKIVTFKQGAPNRRVLVYAPTFRDMDARYDYGAELNTPFFNDYLKRNQMLLVIKGHTGAESEGGGSGLSRILFYDNHRDGYPLLNYADILITDYSSIYMDFLHRRKPVIYFVYDYEQYIADHRSLQFDYNKMTPGPKVKDIQGLMESINGFVEGRDSWAGERERIFKLAFRHHDGLSSERLETEIVERFVIHR